ncbi:FtsX-like permease family protein [Streptacidiphilus rugosus]|uniref:FtsX-like permease family protein n=1 Tax=Streptacidiphilus rugosus TaxID=405783 RepID=UPI00055DF08C|nr:FtsX-like permease family protein [Streptacidiphilus rugosus]
MILAQLLRRRGRALALAAGILVAATSFTLLTSAVTTSRAETVGTVNANARSAYDLLVRPPGATSTVEKQRGQVEANFLSGIFGGITMDQYLRIKTLPGVDVAAPVANIGYLQVESSITVDLSRFVDSGAADQLLRIRPVLSAGLGRYPMADQYLYLTRDPLALVDTTKVGGLWPDVQLQHAGGKDYAVCWYFNWDHTGAPATPYSQGDPMGVLPLGPTPFSPQDRTHLTCESGRSDHGRATLLIPVAYPVLLTAVDPVAESRLIGLGSAVTSGRMLREGDTPRETAGVDERVVSVPVLLSSRAMSAGTIDTAVQRVDVGGSASLPALLGTPAAYRTVEALPGSTVGSVRSDLASGFLTLDPHLRTYSGTYWTVGPIGYRATPQGLVAATRPPQPYTIWKPAPNGTGWTWLAPEENTGPQFRSVTPWQPSDCRGIQGTCAIDPGVVPSPTLDIVGRYDPARLDNFSTLSSVPLETYQSPAVTGADAASRAALGGRPLLPDRNLGGYMSQPPTLLTTLSSIAAFTTSRSTPGPQLDAPVSAIRLRVAGVTGVDKASQARVNAVAAEIRAAYPALEVDVTVGSSPMPQTIVLPGGVRVVEGWTAKGVALRILSAVDAKSAVLFVLVLVVCALFLGQAALASVRSRRTEIGTLRCLGWSAGEVFRLMLGELLLIGAAAGAAGALLAYALAAGFGLHTSAAKAALVLPTAVLLALLAGLPPAWRATRVGPLDAVDPPVAAVGRARPVRTVRGLALRNLLRVPGRSVLGAAGLALGVAAFTVLLGVTLAFHGEVAGSLLGDAVVARARTVDYASVALSLLLGAAGAVDVLVLSQRERAADLAVLRACGWSTRELARLTLAEGVWLSALGGAAGAGAGLGVLAALGRGLLGGGRVVALTTAGLLAAAAGVALVCAALAFAIRALSRLAPARLLAADQ